MVPLTVSLIVVWGLMVTQVVGLVAPFAVNSDCTVWGYRLGLMINLQ